MCWIPFPYRKTALTITLAFHAVKHRSLEMLLNGIFKVSCTLADKISSLISIFVIDNNLFQYFQNMFPNAHIYTKTKNSVAKYPLRNAGINTVNPHLWHRNPQTY